MSISFKAGHTSKKLAVFFAGDVDGVVDEEKKEPNPAA